MSATQEIFSEYVRMRENGLDTREALRALRIYVEALPSNQKDQLAQRLREWEQSRAKSAPPPQPTPENTASSGSVIRPLRRTTVGDSETVETRISSVPEWIECPNCGKKNQSNEIFCYACGYMLDTASGAFDTRHFASATEELYSNEYFGLDSVLMLTMRDLNERFELRPQLRNHELVIGRSTSNSAMAPDVDLSYIGGAEKGVSRLHLAIRYQADDNAIQIYDLGSANGSCVNGQRLHPRELRILRNGDQLRLGRLVLQVRFMHPGEEVSFDA